MKCEDVILIYISFIQLVYIKNSYSLLLVNVKKILYIDLIIDIRATETGDINYSDWAF